MTAAATCVEAVVAVAAAVAVDEGPHFAAGAAHAAVAKEARDMIVYEEYMVLERAFVCMAMVCL